MKLDLADSKKHVALLVQQVDRYDVFLKRTDLSIEIREKYIVLRQKAKNRILDVKEEIRVLELEIEEGSHNVHSFVKVRSQISATA